ncbi:hypothetical protein [Amycolatopsis suaedae]|uniref:Helix-hairpin-helix domain-containing protein n=1 Tax=Amycolatopsis suaedae TaxID=2510978 RepID=A0A4Q7JEC8_9PSEU|nr:hypothetical protein [Amycolatopsis suaedae]RZQ65849.1 hypothetical protein EWH70_01870 [Amycolatopsis suaedae]
MTTRTQLRKTALSLPEAVEAAGEFAVAGAPFAAAGADGRAVLRLSEADAGELLAAHPTAERVPDGVRIPLADLDGQQLNHWVRRAWVARAPERLARQAAAADAAVPGEVGDLPKAIGRPATRALVNAGITSLRQVAEVGEARLRALHGVGPKAVRILLDATGQ